MPMKKIFVVIVNVFIMLAMITFVIVYSVLESKNATQRQIEHFENTTITMEHVTENYLEGEQRVCDVWSHYINSQDMTMDEAVSFIRVSHVLKNASAHIVYDDTLEGLSTRSKTGSTDDYNVNYSRMNLLDDISWIHETGTAVNISRAYTNPVNGEQSIAFCNIITLNDGTPKKAVLFLEAFPLFLQQWD